MSQQPLTNLQIWGMPDEDMPEPEEKDYFEVEYEKKEAAGQRLTPPSGQG
jgi:hypothetical protein